MTKTMKVWIFKIWFVRHVAGGWELFVVLNAFINCMYGAQCSGVLK